MQVAAGGENADGRLAEPRNGLTTSESSGPMRHPRTPSSSSQDSVRVLVREAGRIGGRTDARSMALESFASVNPKTLVDPAETAES